MAEKWRTSWEQTEKRSLVGVGQWAPSKSIQPLVDTLTTYAKQISFDFFIFHLYKKILLWIKACRTQTSELLADIIMCQKWNITCK